MLGDRPAAEDRRAKISLHEVLDIEAVLYWQRFVETQMACQQVEITLGGIDVQQQMHRVP